MKGLTHYILGIAVASFFANLVEASWEVKSLIILLGGVFALLPDTLDFRFSKFIQKHDYEVHLDPEKLDVEKVAKVIKEAVERAKEEGREVNVKLHSVKIGPDAWRSYVVTLNEDSVVVTSGPIITTGKEVITTEGSGKTAEEKFSVKLYYDYDKDISVDILSGPDISFVPEGDGVRGIFIPWHRKWSHSFTAAIIAGLIGLLIGILTFGLNVDAYSVGLMCFLAYSSHIISDHLGVMGSNFFPPFTKRRTPGFKLTRSMSVAANLLTNFTSFVIILWNFNVFGPQLVFDAPWNTYLNLSPKKNFLSWYLVGLFNLLAYFVIPPAAVFAYISRKKKIKEDVFKEEIAEGEGA